MTADPSERESALEEVLQRRVAPRRRTLQGLVVLFVLGAVVGLIGHSISSAVKPAQQASTIENPVPPGPVLVLSNVSYGSVRVNGRLLAGSPPLMTTFRQGQNTITLTAAPFGTRTCHIQWPYAQVQGLCDVGRDVVVGPSHVGGRLVSPVATLTLWLGGDDLPANVRNRALASISATLDDVPLSATVPAGDYIATGQTADGHITSMRASDPVHADFFVTPTSSDFSGDVFCEDMGCAALPKGEVPGWVVSSGVSVQWLFTPLGGGQPVQSPVSGPVAALRLVLVADQAGNWTVDQQGTTALNGYSLAMGMPSTDCQAGASYLATRAPSDLLSVGIVAYAGLAGCELQLTDANRANRGTFVWRFGVLLAADAQAQAVLPDLPVAPPDEVLAVAV
jgi:hypothetical protein